MRTPEQVALDAIVKVRKQLALTGELGSALWQSCITEEAKAYRIEIAKEIADRLVKVKGLKAKDRKAVATELDLVFAAG